MENKKVIILTGASAGIGFETAKFLAQNGNKVYGLARRLEAMEPLKEFGVKPIQIDLLDIDKLKTIIDSIIEEEGRIDVLINNAGYSEHGSILDVTKENAQRQLNINVIAPMELFKLVFPIMKEKNKGLIINISSMGGRLTFPFLGWYHASKYSIEALSNAMRLEYKKFGINTVIIEPGVIKTEFYDVLAEKRSDLNKDSLFHENYILEEKNSNNTIKKGTNSVEISELINKIIESKKPKARYVKGYGAKPLLFINKYFPKAFDKLIIRMYGLK